MSIGGGGASGFGRAVNAHAYSGAMSTMRDEKKLQVFAGVLWKVRKRPFPTQYQRGSVIRGDTLLAIAKSEDMRVTYAELEALVGRPQRTLQYVIRDLEDMGLVTTELNAADRRRRIVCLTDAGIRTFRSYVDYVEEKLRVLTEQGYGLPSDRSKRS
ncbi:MAG TPA: winged helix DNA-binding protein [Alphaproteobacteria bacterium]|nr:winged helix DNA-binding protein [Alphaproteobacteria bacterium]